MPFFYFFIYFTQHRFQHKAYMQAFRSNCFREPTAWRVSHVSMVLYVCVCVVCVCACMRECFCARNWCQPSSMNSVGRRKARSVRWKGKGNSAGWPGAQFATRERIWWWCAKFRMEIDRLEGCLVFHVINNYIILIYLISYYFI